MKTGLNTKSIGLICIACLCIMQSFSKENLTFLYGGVKGKKHGGKVKVVYNIKSGKKKIDLNKVNHVVDLNAYKEPVTISIQFSQLKLGLNKAADKIRHNDHSKVFYMEIRADESYISTLKATQAPVKLAAANSHYGLNEVELHYLINSAIPSKKTINLATPILIVDGVYNRKWIAKTTQKSIFIIPKRITPVNDPCMNKICRPGEVCMNGACIQRPLNECEHCKKNELCVNNTCVRTKRTGTENRSACNCENYQVCINNRCEKTAAYKLWESIQEDSLGLQNHTLKNCELYLNNCKAGIFNNCLQVEEVLCIQLKLAESDKRLTLEELYLENYPEGKCKEWILEERLTDQEKIDSIQPNLAKLQVDKRALVVHCVSGGAKPYYIDFFDLAKNKTYPIKRERFNKEYHCLTLENLKIPEGNYQVKVVDKAGNTFTEAEEIFVEASAGISKSAIALSIVLCAMLLFSLYRKYVHF